MLEVRQSRPLTTTKQIPPNVALLCMLRGRGGGLGDSLLGDRAIGLGRLSTPINLDSPLLLYVERKHPCLQGTCREAAPATAR